MVGPQLELYWEGQLVGYLGDAKADMFHLYGRWIPGVTPATDCFLSELQCALAQSEGLAGLAVLVGEEQPINGEVTELSDGVMNVQIGFPRST
jgi:hypothetical protein